MSIKQNVQELSPGDIITLIELDLTPIGYSLYRFHDGTNELNLDITWQGNIYTKFPIELDGFESKTQGSLARPTMKIATVGGLVSLLLRATGDLVGGKITRKRTMVKYLDAVNFTGGINATADQNVFFADDVYYIDRKTAENKVFASFELVSSLDIEGIKIPRRQIIQNSCTWIYRSAECTFAGGAVANTNDEAVADINLDVCGKRLASCILRFGSTAVLPYGGFPGSGLLS